MDEFLTFTGPLRELKQWGFHHTYMYASNYRCWTSYQVGNNRDTWIWLRGRRVEVTELNSRTVLLLPFLRGKEMTCNRSLLLFQLDMQENTLVAWDWDAHPHFAVLRKQGISDDDPAFPDKLSELQDRSRQVCITNETMDELRLLDANGWLDTQRVDVD